MLLLLACAVDSGSGTLDDRAPTDRSADRRGPDVDLCDALDNDLDGVIDEDCAPCGRFVTRSRTFWSTHACVIAGDATGTSLTIAGAHTGDVITPEDLAASLGTVATNPHDRLGQELITARLNVAAFDLGTLAYQDVNGDGTVDPASTLIAAAENAWNRGTARDQRTWADRLRDFNSIGTGMEPWFDESCAAEPELCNGLDDDLDGTVDEACACHEVCDDFDNDYDGLLDEGCAVACPPLSPESWTMGEALARGQLSVTSESKARVVITNTGALPILLDEQLIFTSPDTQSFVPAIEVSSEVLGAGESITLRYASHTTDNGHYSPYLGEPGWWCVESGQPTAAGAVFDLYGEVVPEALATLMDTETDGDADGVEDHVDWAGTHGVESQYAVWEAQDAGALLTVGKWAGVADGRVDVTVLARNFGAADGVGVLTDTLPAGWSAVSYDADAVLDLDAEGRQTLSWTLSLAGYDSTSTSVLFDAQARSYSMVRDSGADSPEVELGAAALVVGGVTSASVHAWVFDYDANGDGIVECDG